MADAAPGTVRGIDVSAVATGGYKFDGICSAGGKVYAAPEDASQLLEYDTASGTVRGIDVSAVATGADKFNGICSAGGKVYAAPRHVSQLLEYEQPVSQPTKTAALEAQIVSLSKENERKDALIASQSKELERMAAASQPAGAAAGSGAAAARAGRVAEGRLAELKEVLVGLQLSASILDSGASFGAWLAEQGFIRERKFEVTMLTFGRSSEAAGGLEALLGVDDDDLDELKRGGLGAMRAEFEKHGAPEDMSNFRYVVDGIALDDEWVPEHVKDDMKQKKYHGGDLEPGDYDMNHTGYKLQDFVATPDAKLAGLKDFHVAALRLYTTSSFRKFNAPLRKRVRPHPFAITVWFLAQGLKKLRKAQAELDPKGFATESSLWRGMRNVTMDLDKFRSEGGTELGPMSTSTDFNIACKYAASESPLILRYKVQGLTRGVSLKFLSVYPKEQEYLYPPGCFLEYQSTEHMDGFEVVTVVPQMA